jgi:hypothetical protein
MRERVPCAALLQSWIPDEFWQHNAKKGLGKLTMVWRALPSLFEPLKLQFSSRKDVEYPATKNVLMLLHVKQA